MGKAESSDLPELELGEYEHYKGGRYRVLGVGLDSETLAPVVIYEPFDGSGVPFWVRPYEMFLEEVEVNGTKVPRFRRVS